jgi:hypothetical protein
VAASGRAALAAYAVLILVMSVAAAGAMMRAREQGTEAGGLRVGGAAGALRIEDSRKGRAVLRASALAPGGSVAGAVTISSRGAAGRLVLAATGLVEAPGPGGGVLGRTLRLQVRELSRGSHRTFYAGPLAAMPKLHLGPLSAGSSRRFRFRATLPAKGLGESLMGSAISFDYRWRLKPLS